MITLINPPGLEGLANLNMNSPNAPLGLAYVAAVVKQAGHRYHVIDATSLAMDSIRPYPGRDDFVVQGLGPEEIAERVPPETETIGITCMFSTLWPLTRLVAEAVRARFPEALMVLGGEHGTAVPDYVLHNSPFDVVVLGEGEETFLGVIAAHNERRSLRDVRGIAFREAGEVINTGLSARNRNLDDIPHPDWESFPIEEYISRHQNNGVNLGRSMQLLATRGCPYQCTFCSNPGMWTTQFITRNPKLLADEIELYMRKYRATNFDFQDLTTVVKRSWVVEFCNEIIDRGLEITWQMPSGTRSEIFDEEVADLLYRSGCRVFAFAPESGDPEMLKKVKKQVDLDKLLKAARIVVRRGFSLSCFLVIGFPDDTRRSLKMTTKLVRKLAVVGVHDVAVSKFVPYPGSLLFKQLQAEGRIELDDAFFISPMDFYSQRAPSYSNTISTRRLYWTMMWMFWNFYLISFAIRPLRVARILFKAMTQGSEETRYAKWLVNRLYTRKRRRKIMQKAVYAFPSPPLGKGLESVRFRTHSTAPD